ncbi:MAG: asparagine synthase (glutamine-hydrolyzing) [Candidatus Parcubacteria bacterium]|nr:asparagine synthase (glutamine-hydrolyzing) [Burkholderiales bacterium]
MCGVAGLWSPRGGDAGALLAQARAMADTLAHRGPDDAGAWADAASGLALGHRRLSVLDLSSSGHQPMASGDGRHVISYNGEIYNYAELHAALEAEGRAPEWRGRSDTEVLLAAVSAWGMDRALQRVTGMFAFALWDTQEKTLHLARDRMGEKPLYYGWAGAVFCFASELKAWKAVPGPRPDIDRRALGLYARYGNVPAPECIYEGVRKLPAGAWLSLGAAQFARRELPEPRHYWTLARSAPFVGSESEAADELERRLANAVRRQMISDVPLGAFLSGGVDSSTVVALMQATSARPVKTFTIGFPEERYNEADQASAVAAHLGTSHTELYVTPREAMDVIPKLPELYDEPFADSSQIPTFLVSRLARTQVTVSLSGDGGDELFGGYNRYFWGPRLWRWIGAWPQAVALADRPPAGVPASVPDEVVEDVAVRGCEQHGVFAGVGIGRAPRSAQGRRRRSF